MANGMGSLYVGATGLKTSQIALNTTANNLANVDTKGYVRQQVLFGEMQYNTSDFGASISKIQVGLGVSIGDVIHARDMFLDKSYRHQSGRQGFYSSMAEATEEIQNYFQEMEGQAYQDTIRDLWVSFQELSKDPSDSINQNLIIQKADIFIDKTEGIRDSLKDFQLNQNKQITSQIDQVNEIGYKLFQLNQQIQSIEVGDVETAVDLRDQRDLLLDQLSSFVNVSCKEKEDGTIRVSVEGIEFVNEARVYEMTGHKDGETGFVTPYWSHLSDVENDKIRYVFVALDKVKPANLNDVGSLKGMIMQRGEKIADYRDIMGMSKEDYNESTGLSVITEIQAQLDQMFHYIVTKTNDILAPNKASTHKITGKDEQGREVTFEPGTMILDEENAPRGKDLKLPPTELFQRNGCERYTKVTGNDGKIYYVYNQEDMNDRSKMYTIGSVKVNEEIEKESAKFPCFLANGKVDYSIGDKINAMWNASALRINPNIKSDCSIKDYYAQMIGDLGNKGSVYETTAVTLEGAALAVDNQRQQQIGVSSDEELSNMIKYQSAYNAASRYISVVSEMLEHLVTSLGR